MSGQIICADVLDGLAMLPEKSVHCIMTSPPYFNLRTYFHPGEIGCEKTVQEYIDKLVACFGGCWRVLRDDGTLWVVIGDSFATGKGTCFNPGGGATSLGKDLKAAGVHPLDRGNKSELKAQGLKPKDLLMVPARLALALQAEGWYLRQMITWAKGISFCPAYAGSTMPSSVTDRPISSHENILLLSKSPRYFYDRLAVTEPCRRKASGNKERFVPCDDEGDGRGRPHVHVGASVPWEDDGSGRNLRSVWAVSIQAGREQGVKHYAKFPEGLVEPCIKAGTSQRGCCPKCLAPWKRISRKKVASPGQRPGYTSECTGRNDGQRGGYWIDGRTETVGWEPGCGCQENGVPLPPVPCTVLDCFLGSGTTALVASRLGRDFVGIDIQPEYVKMATDRLLSAGVAVNGVQGVKTTEVPKVKTVQVQAEPADPCAVNWE